MADTINPPDPARPGDTEIRPKVKPGEKLGYASTLNRLPRRPLLRPPFEDPVRGIPLLFATPFLVIPASLDDEGSRPVSGEQGFHSHSVMIVEVDSGNDVSQPVPNHTYELRCRIDNRGVSAVYSGIAEFYTLNFLPPSGATVPARGYAGFVVMPGDDRKTVICPHKWTPSRDETTSIVLVHAYDPFLDPLVSPFDALSDRHVGRRDLIIDFSGTWAGVPINLPEVTIGQTGFDVSIKIETPSPTPPFFGVLNYPDVSSSVVGGEIRFTVVHPAFHTPEDWKLFLLNSDTLHFERTPQDRTQSPSSGDLRRVFQL